MDWRAHAWKHIHPVQDIQAQVLAKNNHLNAGDDFVAESGKEAEEVDLKNILARKRRRELEEEHLPNMEEESVDPDDPDYQDPDDDSEDDDESDEKTK